jgi:hypothetical protein
VTVRSVRAQRCARRISFFEAVAHPANSKDAKIMPRRPGTQNNPDRRPLSFRQREVARAIRSVQATGLPISGVDIDPRTGKITIMTGPPTGGDVSKNNPWDKEFPNAANKERVA